MAGKVETVEDVDQEKGNRQEDEEEYVAVEEQEDRHGDSRQREDVDDDNDDDDDDHEDEEETRLGGGREDDDDEEKKARRREENRSRRQRQKEARDRTERELRYLRNRNEQLERRFSETLQEIDERVTGSEIASVDSQISKAKSDLALANQVIAQAAEQNDGANLAEALDHRDSIRDRLRELEGNKEYLSDENRRRPRSGGEEQLDPRHVAHAQRFMVDHDWWDPRGADQDSQAVLMIDRSLVQEGYNPAEKSYWDELRERVREQLPHHFNERGGRRRTEEDGDRDVETGNGKTRDTQDRRTRGPQFRTGGRERPLKKNEVYISRERREAMEEAGVWDDPVLRNKYLKAYANYDKQAQEGA